MCVYTMDFVTAGKKTLLYETICKKSVPRLNEHDDVIKWNFMKIAPPPKWRAVWAPAPNEGVITKFSITVKNWTFLCQSR